MGKAKTGTNILLSTKNYYQNNPTINNYTIILTTIINLYVSLHFCVFVTFSGNNHETNFYKFWYKDIFDQWKSNRLIVNNCGNNLIRSIKY